MATIASLHDIDILCLKRLHGFGLGVKVGSGRRLFERFQTGEEEDLSGFCSGRSVCHLWFVLYDSDVSFVCQLDIEIFEMILGGL